MEHAQWLANSKAAASSASDNPLGQAQRLTTTIIWPASAAVQHITVLASDQAAQLQSP